MLHSMKNLQANSSYPKNLQRQKGQSKLAPKLQSPKEQTPQMKRTTRLLKH